jgi:sialate O-acetylesterase
MKTALGFLLLPLVFISFGLNAQFKWPDGKKAAVVFTYDDALDCHLDVAVPQLDEFGFKGTFYCSGNSRSLYKRVDEWRDIAKNGHELGNHTMFHPCDGRIHKWVRPERDLNNYTHTQILAEISQANILLKAIDGKTERSFCYTCCDYVAGGVDFTNDIIEMFPCARLEGPIPDSMVGYNIHKTPSLEVDNNSAEELIAYVEQAREKGTIAIFMFHGVGGGYSSLDVKAEEHRKLLSYIKENEEDYFTGTFLEVMKYIQQHR